MEIKVLCICGTKLGFEVEPVEGRMPFALICPNCQTDCTEGANTAITAQLQPGAPPPAPATPSAPAPAAPSFGLRVKGHEPASTPPAAPSAPPPAPAAQSSSAGGLTIGLKHKTEPAEPPPQAAAEEVPESAEAVRARRRAEAQAKQAEDNQKWGKVAMIGRIAIGFAALMFGVYVWYYFLGSRPKLHYTVHLPANSSGAKAKLLGPDQLLVVDSKGVSLLDIKQDKSIWTVAAPTAGDADKAAEPEEQDPPKGAGMSDDNVSYAKMLSSMRRYEDYRLHVTATDAWVLYGKNLLQIDRNSGQEKKRIPVEGYLNGFAPSEKSLLIVTSTGGRSSQIMRVDLATGESTIETGAKEKREDVKTEVEGVKKPPTAGNLMQDEFLEQGGVSLAKQRSEYVPAGDHAVRMDIRLVEGKVTQKKVMRDAPTDSKLNSKTSASSNPFAIANETFNEIKRSSGGAYAQVDESIYEVSLQRFNGGDATSSWTGKVTGSPSYFPAQTVDVVTGNKELFIVSKEGKELSHNTLQYGVGERTGTWRRKAESPAVESDGLLFFRDKGMLTAFELSSGRKKWDFTSVGITSIVPDGKGAVYICSTTASVDSIDYPEDVQTQNRPRGILLKLDAKSGKAIWTSNQSGTDVYLSGKFLYATRPAGSTLTLMGGDDQPSRTWIMRINPRNGKSIWEYNMKGEAEGVDVLENRIMVLGDEEIKVMKFLTL